ncbi:hypothetical protein CPC08DRAFT_727370 [Agrocybe pediades]|nr:hypothetical protein CPC08DRAFT_727370 [Agrocybe pediades]
MPSKSGDTRAPPKDTPDKQQDQAITSERILEWDEWPDGEFSLDLTYEKYKRTKNLMQIVTSHPTVGPQALTTGVPTLHGPGDSVADISDVLLNYGCVAKERSKIKLSQEERDGNILEQFAKFEDEHPGFVILSQLVKEEEIDGPINRIEAQDRNLEVQDSLFKGVMDFSEAERTGFTEAFIDFWSTRVGNEHSPEDCRNAIEQLLHGCEEHYRAAITRVSCITLAVPLSQVAGFRQHCVALTSITDKAKFDAEFRLLMENFHKLKA